jgi:hypothetical protein
MSTDANAVQESESDPLKTIADALEEAANGSPQKHGVAAPALGEYWTRIIYNTSYAVSYGVVMPTALVVSILPKENALMHGLMDGARAARDAALAARQPSSSEDSAAQANGAADAAQNGQQFT